MSKSIVFISSLFALAALTAGCGDDDGDSTTTSNTGAAGATGGTGAIGNNGGDGAGGSGAVGNSGGGGAGNSGGGGAGNTGGGGEGGVGGVGGAGGAGGVGGAGGSGNGSDDIAAVKATADGGGLALPVEGVVVTYTKPLLGQDEAGFFVQFEAAGPALFVAVDPATLAPVPAPGDTVSFTVTDLVTDAGMKQATGISGFSVTANGFDVDTLVTDISAAADVVTNLDAYDARVVSFAGTIGAAFTPAGMPQVAAQIVTAGVDDANLRIRMPEAVRAAFDLEETCTLNLDYGPMWRFNAVAQPSALNAGDIQSVTCPAPTVVSAVAGAAGQVQVTFSRTLDPTSVLANGSQFTFDNGLTASAASATGDTVTVTTSAQSNVTYTVNVANTVEDILDEPLGMPSSTTFSGFTTPAGVVINELNANIGGGCDLIELRVISSGTMDGFKLFQRTTELVTFSGLDVVAGDLILVHLNSGSGTCNPGASGNETTSKNQFPNATFGANVDVAWDWYSAETGLVATDNVFRIENALGVIVDAVFATDDPTGTAAGMTETAAALVAAANQWQMVGGGVPAGGFIDDDFNAHAVLDLNGTGTTAAGTSIQRTNLLDTNDLQNWSFASNSTWGLLNPGQ